MKLWKSLVVALVLVGLTFTGLSVAQAATFRGSTDSSASVVVNDTKPLNDLHAYGNNVIVNSPVSGDLLAAGQTILVTSSVQDDETLAGGTITSQGSIGHDFRAAGNQIILSGSVYGDAYIAGQTVTIGSDSIISGDLYVAGSSIEIDGTVMGTVHIYGGSVIIKGKVGAVSAKVQSLELKKDAIVHHNLTYSAPIGATIDNGANILGKTKYTKSSGSKNEASRLGLDFVLALGKILLLGLLIMLWPKFWNIALDKFQKSPLANFGWGLVAIIAAPLVLIALLATAIGIPIALISGLVWITLLYIGSLASKLYVGSFLAKLITKNEAHRVSWLSASLGIIAIGLIEFIPVLGPIFNGILTIMGIGALTALLFTLRRSR